MWMHAYENLTAPVLRHYQTLHRLIEVDGEGTPEAVAGRVETALQALRTNQ